MEKRNDAEQNPMTETTGQVLVMTRIFDAPRLLVWKAWTDPEHFKKWWGPKNFTAPVVQTDLRVGGKYIWCMKGSDGKEYWTTGVFMEIKAPERLVYTDTFADENGNAVPASHYGMEGEWEKELIVTITLEEKEGKTIMTLRHTGIPAGEMSDLTNSGWNESFDKLAASLK